MLSSDADAHDLFLLLEKNFWALDRFFLGLTQGRRPRAGNAFEMVLQMLFDKLEYPYARQPIINGQPDFLLPSQDYYASNAMDCIIFTVKRTLRERWRQIISEGTRGHQFFLATIDDGVAQNDLDDMKRNRVYLVVPESIKKSHYHDSINVITFEAFLKHHLDPAMIRWRETGAI